MKEDKRLKTIEENVDLLSCGSQEQLDSVMTE